jgi:hypothetical protein
MSEFAVVRKRRKRKRKRKRRSRRRKKTRKLRQYEHGHLKFLFILSAMASTEPYPLSHRFGPLEPTHIVLEGEFEEVRSRVCEVVCLFDAIEVDGVYEFWLNNSPVFVRVNILTTTSSSLAVEFRKIRGDTVEFVKLFVSILRVFRHWAESSPPRVVVEATSATKSWDWIREHACDPNRFHSAHIDLRDDIMAIDEILEPVICGIRSEWYQSQMDGLECACSLTELDTNATILSNHAPFLRALGTIDITDRAVPQVIRCFAKTVANMYTAPRMKHTHLLFNKAAAFYLDILVARIAGLYHAIKDRPSWHHSIVHIERIRRIQEAAAGEQAAAGGGSSE